MTMKTYRYLPKSFARTFLLLGAICVASLAAWAQMPQQQGSKTTPLSQVERKNKAPVSKDVLQVKLPKPFEAMLPNGVTVLILEDHRLPVANASIQMAGAGAIFEPSDRPGLASITAQMMTQGTTTRTSKQIAEETDRLGANVFAQGPFGSGSSAVSSSGLSDNLDQWFALMTDVLLHPSFSDDELVKLKVRLKASLKQNRTFPGFLVNERFSRAVYGNFPASVVSATDASIDGFTANDLRKWHDQKYAPQHALLTISGDVSAAALMPKLQQWLGAWQKTDASDVTPGKTTPTTAKKIYLVDRPASVQTSLYMGNIGIDRKDPDYITMVVLNQILGAGPQARLFMNLRENKGYTYGAYSGFTALKYAGAWQAYSDVRTEVTDGAMTEFMNELNRIRNEKVPQAELDEAKRAVVAAFALDLESPARLIFYAGIRKIYDFPSDYWDTYPAKIMAVTTEDVQRVSQKYYSPNAMQIVAVGDASKIKVVMEKYGPVEVYGTDGKPVEQKTAAPASN
jgi:zinc protease